MIEIVSGNHYLVQTRKQAIIKAFLKNNSDLAMEELYFEKNSSTSTEDLLALTGNISLFYPRKLIIVHNWSEILQTHPQSVELAQSIFKTVIEEIDLVLIEANLDQRTKLAKFFSKQANYNNYQAYKGVQLKNWLKTQFENRQSQISDQTADYLIQKVGEDLISLDSEVSKLAVYPKITSELIDKLVVGNINDQIFDLLDKLLQGKYNQALDIYNQQIARNSQPINILGVIIWQLQLLIIVKVNSQPLSEIAKTYGIHEFALRKSKAISRQVSKAYLDSFLDICYQADHKIRVNFIDPNEALLHLITRICNLKIAKIE